MWLSSGGGNNEVVGWFDPKKFEATMTEEGLAGWAPFITTQRHGRSADIGGGDQGKLESEKGHGILTGLYSVSPIRTRTVGETVRAPGRIVRYDTNAAQRNG